MRDTQAGVDILLAMAGEPPSAPDTREYESPGTGDCYCGLLGAVCTRVDCGECVLLRDHSPDGIWLCAACALNLSIQALAHWKDGVCDACAGHSNFLARCVPRPGVGLGGGLKQRRVRAPAHCPPGEQGR